MSPDHAASDDADASAARFRAEVDALRGVGLTAEEAGLIAERRLGATAAAARAGGLATAVGLAVAAGLTVHAVRLAGAAAGLDEIWLVRNASLLLAPGLVVLLGLRRRLDRRAWTVVGAALALVAVAANAIPYRSEDTELLSALHLPVLAWGVVLAAHAGGRIRDRARRTAAVRFSGEVAVLTVLLALGGGVLLGITSGLLAAIGIDAEPVIEWVLPAGAAGAVVIAGWLAETRPRLAGGLAPLLAQVFTPLFGVMVLAVTTVYAATARATGFDRETVALLDLLMVVVLALAVYGQAARSPERAVGWDDRLRLGAVSATLLLDAGVLATMAIRLGGLGATPNRIAALGLNVVLLGALGGTAWRLGRAVRGRGGMAAVEDWQARTVPVLVGWAALVAVLLPLLPPAT